MLTPSQILWKDIYKNNSFIHIITFPQGHLVFLFVASLMILCGLTAPSIFIFREQCEMCE